MDVKAFLDSLDPFAYQALQEEMEQRKTARMHPQHVTVDLEYNSTEDYLSPSESAYVRVLSSDGIWDFDANLYPEEDTRIVKFNPLGLLERHGWWVCAMSQKQTPPGVAIILVRDVLEGEEGICPGLEALRKELENER